MLKQRTIKIKVKDNGSNLTLQDLLTMQRNLQKKIYLKHNKKNFTKYYSDFSNQKASKINISLLKDNILYAIEELAELLDWLPFKSWKNYTKEDYISTEKDGKLNLYEIKMELIDVLHFILNICLILGLKEQDIYKLFYLKNKINHKRQDTNY